MGWLAITRAKGNPNNHRALDDEERENVSPIEDTDLRGEMGLGSEIMEKGLANPDEHLVPCIDSSQLKDGIPQTVFLRTRVLLNEPLAGHCIQQAKHDGLRKGETAAKLGYTPFRGLLAESAENLKGTLDRLNMILVPWGARVRRGKHSSCSSLRNNVSIYLGKSIHADVPFVKGFQRRQFNTLWIGMWPPLLPLLTAY
jgi:hypothetical protein